MYLTEVHILLQDFGCVYKKALEMKLRLILVCHPQTNKHAEQTNQSLEDLLRACMMEQQGGWDKCLPLLEFTHNNFHANIRMTPFKALYGRKCRMPLWSIITR